MEIIIIIAFNFTIIWPVFMWEWSESSRNIKDKWLPGPVWIPELNTFISTLAHDGEGKKTNWN